MPSPRKTDEGYGLSGVGLVFWTWSAANWADTSAVDLREDLLGRLLPTPTTATPIRRISTNPSSPSKHEKGPSACSRCWPVDAVTQTVQFRYRLVENDPLEGSESAVQEDAESERLAQSLERIMRFGLMAWKYAEEHDWQYPEKINELEEYAEPFGQDFQWILENVEYVGAGRVGQDPPENPDRLRQDPPGYWERHIRCLS